MQHRIALVEVNVRHPVRQADDGAVGNADCLRIAGRARREQDVGERLGGRGIIQARGRRGGDHGLLGLDVDE